MAKLENHNNKKGKPLVSLPFLILHYDSTLYLAS